MLTSLSFNPSKSISSINVSRVSLESLSSSSMSSIGRSLSSLDTFVPPSAPSLALLRCTIPPALCVKDVIFKMGGTPQIWP